MTQPAATWGDPRPESNHSNRFSRSSLFIPQSLFVPQETPSNCLVVANLGAGPNGLFLYHSHWVPPPRRLSNHVAIYSPLALSHFWGALPSSWALDWVRTMPEIPVPLRQALLLETLL